MTLSTPNKKLKFEGEEPSDEETFSRTLCTSLVLGLDFTNFYNTLVPTYISFFENAAQDIAKVLKRVLKDNDFAELVESDLVKACSEMLCEESPRILDNVEDAGHRTFQAKYEPNSDQNYSIDELDREISKAMTELKGLISADSLLEQRSIELQTIRQNLERLCEEDQTLKLVHSS